MESFFAYQTSGGFILFSLSHLAMLFLAFFVSLAMFFCRSFLSQPKPNASIRILLAFILLFSEIAYQSWMIWWGQWNAASSLPLQLCSISLILCIFLLLTRSRWLYEIVYFIGLGGAGQALLTPELFYPFPHFRFLHFFIAHEAIIWTVLFFTWVEKYRPTWKSLVRTMGLLNAYMIVMLIINKITNGNYLFLAEKPANPSLIDFLGPYPWYILSLEGVALVLFFILYLPFWSKNKS